MSVGSIIYLIFLLLFFAGGFIFFIIMDFFNEKKSKTKNNKPVKTKKNKSKIRMYSEASLKMRNYIKAKWKKINPKYLMWFNCFSMTVSGILLFLIWLMFLTNNFYPKSDSNLAAKVMKWPLQISIWPVTLIILFVVIMPVWVTKNFELLAIFLFLTLIFLLFNILFLVFLNVSSLWILWLNVVIISFLSTIFTLFSIYYLNKKKKEY